MDAVERFVLLVSRSDQEIDLAEGALTVASAADPDLEVSEWLDAIKGLARGIEPTVTDLRRRLFAELGYRGNSEDYDDPENSLLHRVIERRVGIPLTLSILTMEIGRRVGVQLEGIGMPGHFLVRDPMTGTVYDPFNGGVAVDMVDCERLFRAATGAGPEVRFGEHLLPVASTTQILTRMLNNLRAIFHLIEDPWSLEWVMRMRLALPETDPRDVVELGDAIAKQGRFMDAANEIETYAIVDPDNAEALELAARSMRARLN